MSGATQLELRRLGFVRSYASSALTTGESVYKKLRALVPSVAEPYVAQVEDSAAAYAAPIVASANDRVADVLGLVDAKVDSLFGAFNSTLEYSRSLHAKNMGSFASAKEGAYGLVEGYVNATKAALDPQRYVDYATGLGKSLVEGVVAYADPDKAAGIIFSTYDKVAAIPPVSKALELADPLITVGQGQYSKIHDVLVAQPLYKQLYDTAAAVPAFVTGTGLYRRGYPLVAPVADPVISNFTKSKVIKQIETHLKPKAA